MINQRRRFVCVRRINSCIRRGYTAYYIRVFVEKVLTYSIKLSRDLVILKLARDDSLSCALALEPVGWTH